MMTQTFEYVFLQKQQLLEQRILREKVYMFLWPLCFEYPRFRKWYNSLFEKSGEICNEREIIICLWAAQIVGVAILKKNEQERKICTLRVDHLFQRRGVGRTLIEKSLEWLDDERPLITVRQTKAEQFRKLFDYYGFKLEQSQRMYYTFLGTEHVYNGELPERKGIVYNRLECLNLSNLLFGLMRKGAQIDTDTLINAVVYYEQNRALDFGLA